VSGKSHECRKANLVGQGNTQDHQAPSISRPRGLGGQTGVVDISGGGAPEPGLTAKSSRSRDRRSSVILDIPWPGNLRLVVR